MQRARQWLLFLIPAVLCAGGPRFARLASFDGDVQVQIHSFDMWEPAARNLPCTEASRIETRKSAHAEIELDEGSAFRLLGSALAELSDYAVLSTGQRITLISLDRGIAYFTGHPGENDSLSVAVPGAQVVLRRASQVRFVVTDDVTEIAILEGTVRFSTPTAEMELRRGQLVEVNPANRSKFKLLREISELESDHWTNPRANELEHAGHWMQTDDAGLVWKPKVAEDWAPFQAGTWRWYDELGYTWVAAEPWGWKPYHYGRWLQDASLGWVWSPGKRQTFKPGEVYWLTAANFIGWGALAPGESWSGAGHPRQYAALNTMLGRFEAGMHEFGPASDLPKPKDLLKAARFAVALPSPPVLAARYDTVRPALRAADAKMISFAADSVNVPGASYSEHTPPPSPPKLAPVRAQAQAQQALPHLPQPASQPAPQPALVEVVEPFAVYYPYPVFTGFVVLNPPVKKKDSKDKTKPDPFHGGY